MSIKSIRCPKCGSTNTDWVLMGQLGSSDAHFECECFDCEHTWQLSPSELNQAEVIVND